MNSKAKVGNNGGRSFTFTLNDGVSLEILLPLPPKSVFRFKSARKRPISLPSSKKLKLRPCYLLKASDSDFFYFNPFTNVEKPLTRYRFPLPNPRVVNSCNGLMLLRSRSTDRSFHVYNPTTKQSREIRVIDNEPHIVELSLAFDPSKSPHYKIVCIKSTTEAGTDPYEEHTYQIEVYDSESCTWSLRLGPFTFPRLLFIKGEGVYWDGAIYWEILDEIGYYDIRGNEFGTLALPNYRPIRSQGMVSAVTHRLQRANGRLCHSKLVTRGDWKGIEVFELYRSSWLLKYFGRIFEHDEPTASSYRFAHQLGLVAGAEGGEEACNLVAHLSGKISVHNFFDCSTKLLVDLSDQPYYREDFNMEMYEFGKCLSV